MRRTIALMCHARTMGRPEYYGNPAGLTADIDVVKTIYAAFEARDLERALTFIDPDCEIHLEGTARQIGRTEPYRGHDGMREYFIDVERAWDELTIHATDFRVVPGSVFVMGYVSGRLDGRPFRTAAVWNWRVRDGKAYYFRVADMGARP